MKNYLFAAIMLSALSACVALFVLSLGYMDPDTGHGLHPAAAGVGMIIALAVGFAASGEIGKSEPER